LRGFETLRKESLGEASGMRLVCAVLALFVMYFLGGGCSSDPDCPLGSEFVDDGLIHPDSIEVVQDTVRIATGAASFVVSDYALESSSMELGRRDGVETWPVLRMDFSSAGDDKLRTVKSASLVLTITGEADTLHATFVELTEPLVESDTLKSIALGVTIPDSTYTNVDRVMKLFPRAYSLPPGLVESWIKGDVVHNGLAVVLNDPTATKRLAFGTHEAADSAVHPILRVFFTTGDESRYRASADGTFAKDLWSTENLLVSDVGARRVFVPVELGVFDPNTLVHEANLVLHVVPGSMLGADTLVSGTDTTLVDAFTLYSPGSGDVESPGILTGTTIASVLLADDPGVLRISIGDVVSSLLARKEPTAWFVLRYTAEGSEVRRAQFFAGDAPDSLKPAVTFTYSTAPKFGG
jgi:hypothetical protein